VGAVFKGADSTVVIGDQFEELVEFAVHGVEAMFQVEVQFGESRVHFGAEGFFDVADPGIVDQGGAKNGQHRDRESNDL